MTSKPNQVDLVWDSWSVDKKSVTMTVNDDSISPDQKFPVRSFRVTDRNEGEKENTDRIRRWTCSRLDSIAFVWGPLYLLSLLLPPTHCTQAS